MMFILDHYQALILNTHCILTIDSAQLATFLPFI